MRSRFTLLFLAVAGLTFVSPVQSATFCVATGHYYDFIPKANTTSWTAARDEAALAGGYLATVTSAAEQACLEAIPRNSGAYWAGGSDAASEDQWRWVTGPEASDNGGLGRQFWQGGPAQIGGHTTAPDFYANWFPPPTFAEPNDSGSGEDFLTWNVSSVSAHWNDVPHTNSAIRGYAIEFDTDPDGATEVAIDIKFCSDPNAFNCRKKGVVPVTIFGTDSFDVADIDPGTLQLCLEDLSVCTNGPTDWSLADRGNPDSDLGAAMCAIDAITGLELNHLNPDQFLDLDAAFDAREVRDMLGVFCSLGKNAVSEALIITGTTTDGTEFFSVPFPSAGIDQLVKKNH